MNPSTKNNNVLNNSNFDLLDKFRMAFLTPIKHIIICSFLVFFHFAAHNMICFRISQFRFHNKIDQCGSRQLQLILICYIFQGKAGYERNIFNDNRGKLDAQAFGTRTLSPYGDSSALGGALKWKNDNAAASFDISKQIHGPTSVSDVLFMLE